MKTSKLTKLVAAVSVFSTIALTSNAALTLTMANYGVGWSDPSAIPPSSADMDGYVETMVGLYNNHADGYSTTIAIAGASDGPFTAYVDKGTLVPGTISAASVSGFTGNNVSVNGGPNSYTIDLGAGGYTYLILGWDGPQGADQLYYIAGLTGEITVSNAELPSDFRKGLSNYWLGTATVVPEPSTVVAGALLLIPLGVQTIRRLRK